MSEPSAKRKRTDDERTAEVIRSDIWLDDGSIVLQADNTQFRFYKGLLARHSQIFADMIAVVHPQNDEHTVEGCTVVTLSDSAQDVRFMLLWLLDPRSYTSKPTVSNILSALRMGHKYMVVPLWDDSVERLRAEFPTSLEAFYDQDYSFWSAMLSEDNHNDILRLIEAVRDAGLETLLPMVYYRTLLECPLKIISKGGIGSLTETPSDTTCIDLDTRVLLLTARGHIIENYRTRYYWWTQLEGDNCDHEDECDDARNAMQLTAWSQCTPRTDFEPALRILWRRTEQDQTKLRLRGLCKDCIRNAEEVYKGNQRSLWRKLPLYFGLPAWEKLKDYSLN
ncbi:hypothetical protein EV121DRAFT_294741 [Schizophyllum commune]